MIKLKVALPTELPVRAALQVESKVEADICLEPCDACVALMIQTDEHTDCASEDENAAFARAIVTVAPPIILSAVGPTDTMLGGTNGLRTLTLNENKMSLESATTTASSLDVPKLTTWPRTERKSGTTKLAESWKSESDALHFDWSTLRATRRGCEVPMKSDADDTFAEQDRRNRTSKGRRDPPPESGEKTVAAIRFMTTDGKALKAISEDKTPPTPARKQKK